MSKTTQITSVSTPVYATYKHYNIPLTYREVLLWAVITTGVTTTKTVGMVLSGYDELVPADEIKYFKGYSLTRSGD